LRPCCLTAGRTVTGLSQDWCTPAKYVEAVREFFDGRIALDPCSNRWSIVRAEVEYVLPNADGLRASWNYRTIYVNPPYRADRARGTTIKDWLRRCADAFRRHNSEVVALVPVAPNTSHWKHFVWGQAAGVAFLHDTRLKFLVEGQNGGKGAPMACAMIYWGTRYDGFAACFIRFGAVVDIRPLQGRPINAHIYDRAPALFG
jgi:hypothetical protein